MFAPHKVKHSMNPVPGTEVLVTVAPWTLVCTLNVSGGDTPSLETPCPKFKEIQFSLPEEESQNLENWHQVSNPLLHLSLHPGLGSPWKLTWNGSGY